MVTSGPYQLSRNPMYLGIILMIISTGTYLGTALTFPVVFAFWLFMNKMQINPDELRLIRSVWERVY